MLTYNTTNSHGDFSSQLSAPGASPGSAEAIFDPSLGSAEKQLKAPWAPRSGWYGEPKQFNVVLIAIYSVENSGLRYLSAALRRAGFNVNLIFLRDWVNNKLEMPSPQELELVFKIIADKRANLVGIGFISSLLPMVKELTGALKKRFPNLPICWGGIHVTAVPEGALDFADYLCLGEGEAPLIDLCEALHNKNFTGDIPNIWAKLGDQIYKNEMRPLIANLDELPYPDVDDFNKFYIEDKKIHNEEPWKRTAEYRIYCSRG